jgi:acyl-CoA hydrolase/N-acetylglutamate synthase-like GNAT family acetyltransferase
VTPEQAIAIIKPGSRVFVGSACATPRVLMKTLEGLQIPIPDLEFFHFLTNGALPVVDGVNTSQYYHKVFFVGSDERQPTAKGIADYIPISLAQVPAMLDNGRFMPDVALIQTTMPDEHGYVSLGVSVDITWSVLQRARTIIAEINPNMPWTMGETTIPLDRVHKAVMVDSPVIEYTHSLPDNIAEQIARYIAGLIDDGSTLQIGLGRIPNEAFKYLNNHSDLGIHSDVITETILPLIEKGIITGRKKTMYKNRIVASWCMGTSRFYDFIDGNAMFHFAPIEIVCAPRAIADNNRMVSVTQAFAVDLTGQVCADQFQGEFYSGVSTQPDFLRGAAMSKGGKPIICLESTTNEGDSRIRPLLQEGEGVTVARSDVHYVITEYGIAYLFGKSIRERALALAGIAHPKHRAELIEAAKRLNYVPKEHMVTNLSAYAVEEERILSLKGGRQVLVRPSRPDDVAMMQELFHRLSETDIITRFFHKIRSLSYNEAQRLCNVNQEGNVAFVAVSGTRENESIVGTSCYFLDHSTNLAEVAYMISPDLQSSGLGTALQNHMMDHARRRGIRGFVADILAQNAKMAALAHKSCTNVTTVREGHEMRCTMLFDQ